MCLIIDKNTPGDMPWIPKKATKPIVCYKVSIKRRRKRKMFKRYEYTGLYQRDFVYKKHNMEPEFKEKYKSFDENRKHPRTYPDWVEYITVGFHGFEHFEDAMHERDAWSIVYDNHKDRFLVVLRCEIPAGSTYFYGKTEDGCPCYCSDTLDVQGEVTFKNV